ncbi:MAG: zinc ribbon domain-containing protein [Pirellulaceae bacterium]|jgi:predicted nucleic acid-binding Zn ribbon protein|nr:zinc ribbon domain-containing protein [Pirellulaceae bacterium]
MPIYEYEIVFPNGEGGERFEVLQSIHDEALTKHPESGLPVRRVISAATIAGRWTDMKSEDRLSDRNLAAKGFTKYVKTDDGRYEKTVGKGPDVISGDS